VVYMHCIGTGKTVVARLFGEILKSVGLLSDGRMIEKKASGEFILLNIYVVL
jgi:hypothetical protein